MILAARRHPKASAPDVAATLLGDNLGEIMINQEYLRSIFTYCPSTGVVIRKVSVSSSTKPGDEVGNSRGHLYKRVIVKGKKYYLHRLIWVYMTGDWPEVIDHINGNHLDNRWCNLRSTSQASNLKNQKLHSRNKSGVSGVTLFRNGRWFAKITADGTVYNLGYYIDWFEAVCARKSAENKHGFHVNHGVSRAYP